MQIGTEESQEQVGCVSAGSPSPLKEITGSAQGGSPNVQAIG